MSLESQLLSNSTNTILRLVNENEKLYDQINNDMVNKSDVAFTKDKLLNLINSVEHSCADPTIKLDVLLFALKRYADAN